MTLHNLRSLSIPGLYYTQPVILTALAVVQPRFHRRQ